MMFGALPAGLRVVASMSVQPSTKEPANQSTSCKKSSTNTSNKGKGGQSALSKKATSGSVSGASKTTPRQQQMTTCNSPVPPAPQAAAKGEIRQATDNAAIPASAPPVKQLILQMATAAVFTNVAAVAKPDVAVPKPTSSTKKVEDSVTGTSSVLSVVEASTIETTPPKAGKVKKVKKPTTPVEHVEETNNIDIIFKPGEIVDKRWVVVRKLGEGNFGAVYEATDGEKRLKQPQALKLEKRDADDQVLKIEVAVLEAMKSSPKHVCRMIECGRNPKFNYMVMTLLGPSLSVLRKHSEEQKFSMSTSIRLLLQCFESMRDMHNCGWLHRDLKPSNFAMGKTPRRRRHVYLFDFGLARTYMIKDKDKKMIMRPKRENCGFRGTQRYCSINAHDCLELGRHDDLISTLYGFIEMATGTLAWKQLDECEEVKECKEKNAPQLYKGMPDKLKTLHSYLHTLKYEDRPNYKLLEESLLEIIYQNGYHSQPYDWEKCKVAAKFWNTADLPMESSQSSSLS